MSYVYPVGGQGANPVDNQYDAITIAADTTLEWPFSFTDSTLITAQIMHVTASAPSLSLLMPDASQASVGQSIIIKNQGAEVFTVKDNAGGTILSAAVGISYFIYITDNSTVAGTWATLTFGAGSNAISAASLAGNGLEASASLLQIDTPGSYKNANFSLGLNDRGSTIIWTGGVAAITVPSAASLGGSGYIVFFSNQGTGNAVFTTSGGELINGAASFTFAAGNSGVIICGAQAGNEFVVVGFGQSVTFAFTQLIKDVSGSSNVTLTSSEQANKLIKLIGVLTGNISVIVATTPDFFVVTNATSGAFAITVKTAAGTGVVASSGLSRTMICDGTNVLYANDVGTGTVTGVATGTGLTGGTITTSGTIDLANTAVVAGTYGSTSGNPSFVVDAQGRLTSATNDAGSASVYVATVGGTATAITLTPTVASTAYAAGQRYRFIAGSASSAATTINVSGLGARNLFKRGSINPVAGDWGSGMILEVVYDGTNFQLLAADVFSQMGDIASAGTINLDSTTGNVVDVTGTTTITAITLAEGKEVTVRFTGALTLTNSASLVLPGSANVTTAAGDFAVFRGYAAGVVRCTSYLPFSGIGYSYTGEVRQFAHATVPSGWLECDGSAVSRATYSSLFALLGTTFGAGDGSTTFNIPLTARRTIVGRGGSGTATLANTVGSTGGSETHVLTTPEMPAHTHTTGMNVGSSGGGQPTRDSNVNSTSAIATSSTGGGGAHNNMQPSLVLMFCIKT